MGFLKIAKTAWPCKLHCDVIIIADEDREICTPAGFVGSLHLSNQAILVPETTDSECPLPSTPEELHGLPKIIPSSPTDGSFIGLYHTQVNHK
jgi:hypothetical protein